MHFCICSTKSLRLIWRLIIGHKKQGTPNQFWKLIILNDLDTATTLPHFSQSSTSLLSFHGSLPFIFLNLLLSFLSRVGHLCMAKFGSDINSFTLYMTHIGRKNHLLQYRFLTCPLVVFFPRSPDMSDAGCRHGEQCGMHHRWCNVTQGRC